MYRRAKPSTRDFWKSLIAGGWESEEKSQSVERKETGKKGDSPLGLTKGLDNQAMDGFLEFRGVRGENSCRQDENRPKSLDVQRHH